MSTIQFVIQFSLVQFILLTHTDTYIYIERERERERGSPSSNSLPLQGIQVLIACSKHVEVQSRLEACPMDGNTRKNLPQVVRP